MFRIFKQFAYGLFYVFCWGLFLTVFYLAFLKPSASCFDGKQNQDETGLDCGGPCERCEILALKPLASLASHTFVNNGLVSWVATVRNPNLNYGSDSFEYQINFYDSQNNLVESRNQTSFIYAGETKNLLEVGVKPRSGAVARTEIILKEINWKSRQDWQAPILQTSNINYSIQGNGLVVSGNISNPSNFRITQVIIGALAVDQFGSPAGVSKTELENLTPFEQRAFQVMVPVSADAQRNLAVSATQVFVQARK